MNRGSTYFLRAGIALLGLGILAICIFVLPIGLRTDASGYYRPVIISMYVAAIPFFIALYQSFKLLRFIDNNNAFSQAAVHALRNIKYCGLAVSGVFIVFMPFIFHAGDQDDAPGVIAIALIIIFASFIVATFAGVLQKLLQNVVEIKSENELTV